RPCIGLPAGRWTRRQNRLMAAGRSRIRGSSGTAWRQLVEHLRRTASESGANARAGPGAARPSFSFWIVHFGPRDLCAFFESDQSHTVSLQRAAYLSAGWRENPALTAVVYRGAGAEPD